MPACSHFLPFSFPFPILSAFSQQPFLHFSFSYSSSLDSGLISSSQSLLPPQLLSGLPACRPRPSQPPRPCRSARLKGRSLPPFHHSASPFITSYHSSPRLTRVPSQDHLVPVPCVAGTAPAVPIPLDLCTSGSVQAALPDPICLALSPVELIGEFGILVDSVLHSLYALRRLSFIFTTSPLCHSLESFLPSYHQPLDTHYVTDCADPHTIPLLWMGFLGPD